jgi:hypothetical protein
MSNKTVGLYCKKYRESKNITLIELGGEDQVKNLSAFEHGRSSNYNHLLKYVLLSLSLKDNDNFMNGLGEVVRNGW